MAKKQAVADVAAVPAGLDPHLNILEAETFH